MTAFPLPEDLSEFTFESAAFEMRYPIAVLHWDRAGEIWHAALQRWPELELGDGEPAKTSFAMKNLELTVTLDRLTLLEYWPDRAVERFREVAREFVALVAPALEISTLNRIGYRVKYYVSLPDEASASSAFFKLSMLRLPDQAQFGTKGRPTLPELSVRWQGEALGATVRMRAETRTVRFVPNPQHRDVPPYDRVDHVVAIDVDYYSTVPLAISKIDPAEWILSAHHVIRRDVKPYLAGGR